MAGNPRIVTWDVSFTWDHVTQRLRRGDVIDVPAGSALESAIGVQNLSPLYGPPAPPPEPGGASEPEEQGTPEEAGQDAPASRSRKAAKDDSSEEAAS